MNSTRSTSATQRPATQLGKRGTLEAQLEKDPELSSSRRAEKSQAFEARMLKTGLERRLIAAEESQRELERALSESQATIQRLEGDRRWLAEREQQEREERLRLESAWEAERETLVSSSRNHRSALLELESKFGDLQDDYTTLKRSSSSTVASHASKITALQRQADLQQHELASAQAIAHERGHKIDMLKERIEELEAAQDNTGGSKLGDEHWKVVREELHRQADQLRTSESLNARLNSELQKYRNRNQSIEVLREEKRDLEKKLLKMNEIKERAARLEGELQAARMDREGWAAFLNDPSGEPTSSTPTALSHTLTNLRNTNASLSEECGSLKGLLDHRGAQLAELQARYVKSQAHNTQLEQILEKYKERIARRERKIKLLEMEVASSNAMLATFSAEESVFAEAGAYDSSKNVRIQELEEALTEYRSNNDELLKELEISRATAPEERLSRSDDDAHTLQQERETRRILENDLSEALSRADSLGKSIEELNQKLWEAGVSITMGQSTPRNSVVLQMQANPAAEHFALRRQELDRLKAENAALVANRDPFSGVPRETWDNLNSEKNELVQVVAQKELRLLRLKQVFNAKAGEFREAVSSILGYRLAFQSTRVRLTSMFDTTASMVFDSIPKSRSGGQDDIGTMKLISLGETEGDKGAGDIGKKMRELMQFWVTERSSIPCFLAALTLQCYDAANPGRANDMEMSMDMS